LVGQAHLDVEALYAALDEQRKAKELSWRELAKEAGVSPSTLTRLGQKKRPDVDSFAALIAWLGIPGDQFLRSAEAKATKKKEPETMAMVSSLLRANKKLSKKTVEALEEIIRAAYENLKDKP
jgi:transcriptional regulator with XRE-family HTH domain